MASVGESSATGHYAVSSPLRFAFHLPLVRHEAEMIAKKLVSTCRFYRTKKSRPSRSGVNRPACITAGIESEASILQFWFARAEKHRATPERLSGELPYRQVSESSVRSRERSLFHRHGSRRFCSGFAGIARHPAGTKPQGQDACGPGCPLRLKPPHSPYTGQNTFLPVELEAVQSPQLALRWKVSNLLARC